MIKNDPFSTSHKGSKNHLSPSLNMNCIFFWPREKKKNNQYTVINSQKYEGDTHIIVKYFTSENIWIFYMNMKYYERVPEKYMNLIKIEESQLYIFRKIFKITQKIAPSALKNTPTNTCNKLTMTPK